MSFSALFTTIGAFLKIFVNSNLLICYLGQTLSAIAQPIILNSPGKIASTWFREDKV
jgi:hypothetical protein